MSYSSRAARVLVRARATLELILARVGLKTLVVVIVEGGTVDTLYGARKDTALRRRVVLKAPLERLLDVTLELA